MKNFTDSHLNVNYNWDRTIAETRVIAVKGHTHSEQNAELTLNSCTRANQENSSIFWAYDGTDRARINTPDHLKDNDVMRWVKVLDPALSIPEIACAMTHIALWVRCITINKPIVILEHDAIMLRPFREITNHNSLEYLGHSIQIDPHIKELGLSGYPELVQYYQDTENCKQHKQSFPQLAFINYNYLFPMGLHAYAIDPFMARRLFSSILIDGIINPIDVMVESTGYEISQTGIYAFNSANSRVSTIGFNELGANAGRKNAFLIPGVS